MSRAAPLPVLPYANADTAPRFVLVRIGGLFGFAALAATGLFVPIWWPDDFLGLNSRVTYNYETTCRAAVPIIQAFLGGIGLALVLVARVQTGREKYARFLLAFVLNVIALGMIPRELSDRVRGWSRWTYLSNSL